jgi:hypothetical protein
MIIYFSVLTLKITFLIRYGFDSKVFNLQLSAGMFFFCEFADSAGPIQYETLSANLRNRVRLQTRGIEFMD